MIKLFSIISSFVILLQSFGISPHDIYQLDEFIKHAQFHSEQHGDNVLEFISKHYGALKADHNAEHQEEQEHHDQLPFQQHSKVSAVTDFDFFTGEPKLKTLELSEFKTHHFFYQEPHSSLHLEGVFQPPRQS